MENIWAFLYQTLAASLTAVLLLVVKRLFLDKLSPRWQYGIWAVLAARLLLPAGLGGRGLLPNGRTVLEAAKTLAEAPLASALTDPYGVTRVLAPVPLLPRGLIAPGSVTDVLFYLYAAGVLFCLLWFLFSYLRLRRAVALGTPSSPAQRARLEAVCRQYGLEAPRRVAVCPWVESAFVCGPLGAVLVLPEGEVDDKVLLHELLHLAHGDIWAGVFLCALRCLHWCNPLIWHCCNRAQNDCEALCDQRVLELLEGEARREYGKILLSMACLAGAAPAQSAAIRRDSVPMALALARLNRPSTPARALDAYAKALLTDHGAYLAMAAPAEQQEALARRLDGAVECHLGLSDFLEEYAFPWWEHFGDALLPQRSYQAVWRVYNLLEGPDGAYTGLLVLDATAWTPQDWQDIHVKTLYQSVRVAPDGGGWAVEPRSDWAALPPGNRQRGGHQRRPARPDLRGRGGRAARGGGLPVRAGRAQRVGAVRRHVLQPHRPGLHPQAGHPVHRVVLHQRRPGL